MKYREINVVLENGNVAKTVSHICDAFENNVNAKPCYILEKDEKYVTIDTIGYYITESFMKDCENIAKKIVKSLMASKNERNYDTYASIVNSGYADPLFDDITSAVINTFWYVLPQCGGLTYHPEKGLRIVAGSFILFYATVRQTVALFKGTTKGSTPIDTDTNENGDTISPYFKKGEYIKKISEDVITSGDIEMVESEIRVFIKWYEKLKPIHKKDSSEMHDILKYLAYGYKEADILEFMSISHNRYQNIMRKIKKFYSDYTGIERKQVMIIDNPEKNKESDIVEYVRYKDCTKEVRKLENKTDGKKHQETKYYYFNEKSGEKEEIVNNTTYKRKIYVYVNNCSTKKRMFVKLATKCEWDRTKYHKFGITVNNSKKRLPCVVKKNDINTKISVNKNYDGKMHGITGKMGKYDATETKHIDNNEHFNIIVVNRAKQENDNSYYLEYKKAHIKFLQYEIDILEYEKNIAFKNINKNDNITIYNKLVEKLYNKKEELIYFK